MKDTDTVAIITVGTIIKGSESKKDNEAKKELVSAIKNGFEIISAVPTSTSKYALITYIVRKP